MSRVSFYDVFFTICMSRVSFYGVFFTICMSSGTFYDVFFTICMSTGSFYDVFLEVTFQKVRVFSSGRQAGTRRNLARTDGYYNIEVRTLLC